MAALAAAGIGAAGSILGGITGGKGAKKAAKLQLKGTEEQIAANQANLAKITGLEQPIIDRGNTAGQEYLGLLGLGGSAAASKAALDTFRASSGYQDLLSTGLGAVNADAYARGMGDSGATMKALLAKGMNIADGSQQEYLGNLNGLIQTGNAAIGNISGVNTSTTTANNAARQAGTDAAGASSILQGAALQKAISGLATVGSNFASSYGSVPNYGAYGNGDWNTWIGG